MGGSEKLSVDFRQTISLFGARALLHVTLPSDVPSLVFRVSCANKADRLPITLKVSSERILYDRGETALSTSERLRDSDAASVSLSLPLRVIRIGKEKLVSGSSTSGAT